MCTLSQGIYSLGKYARIAAARVTIAWVVTACLALPALSGCDAVIDCLDSDGPVFNKSTISNPVFNQVFVETIGASVKNEPGDDRFDYHFTFVGNLPQGITYRQSGRDFILDGTATELGTFTFQLRVEVDDGLGAAESGLCYTNRNRSYQLIVQEV